MASFLEIDTKNCKIELACLQMKVIKTLMVSKFQPLKKGVLLLIKVDRTKHIR